jgi:hypothetical protein
MPDAAVPSNLRFALAAARPDWSFVMIGPVVKINPESLPRLPNIHWQGGKTYAELPRYLAGWDAGFMPFALNESTRFISPNKTPGFLTWAEMQRLIAAAIRGRVRPVARGAAKVETVGRVRSARCQRGLCRQRSGGATGEPAW